MEAVSTFLFSSTNRAIKEDVIELMMSYVTTKSRETKELTPFSDYKVDSTPTIRSFLVQQLLKVRWAAISSLFLCSVCPFLHVRAVFSISEKSFPQNTFLLLSFIYDIALFLTLIEIILNWWCLFFVKFSCRAVSAKLMRMLATFFFKYRNCERIGKLLWLNWKWLK